MSAKPTTLPRWATTGTKTEPSSGQKDDGYEGGDKPPAEYENWRAENIYSWLAWLDVGYLQRVDLSDDSPVLATADRDGHARHILGANGLWYGPGVCEKYRFGIVSLAATDPACPNMQDMVVKYKDTGASSYGAHIGGNSSPCLHVTGGTSANGVLVASESTPISNLDLTSIVASGRFRTNSVTSADALYFGLNTGNAASVFGTLSEIGAFFVLEAGSTDLRHQVVSGGGGAAAGSTGVTVATGTWYDWRVEYHGADTPIGADNGGPVARFFVDGVMTNEVTSASVPTNNSQIGLMFAADNTAGAGSRSTGTFSTTTLSWSDCLTTNVTT